MPREGYATRFFLASIHNFWLYLKEISMRSQPMTVLLSILGSASVSPLQTTTYARSISRRKSSGRRAQSKKSTRIGRSLSEKASRRAARL